MNTHPKSASEVALAALKMAMYAKAQETFAVGGVLVRNDTGEILKPMHNNVLRKLSSGQTMTWDPTAHGERQLVQWYYDNRDILTLPNPNDLTVVTSLDPCMMCTGSLLATGFNVGIVAIDDYAGVNHDGEFTFTTLPSGLREIAKSRFGYYASYGTSTPEHYNRQYRGSSRVAFQDEPVDPVTLMGCDAIFGDSVNLVRRLSSDESGLPPSLLRNPADLPDTSPTKARLRRFYPNTLQLRSNNPRIPEPHIVTELRRVADEANASNAVGLIDCFSNLVLCLPDREKTAPVYTAFMEVVQTYSKLRWELANDLDTADEARNYLTVPKHCTFVFLRAPDPSSASGIMDLGAAASCMEGPIPDSFPANLQYVEMPPDCSTLELVEAIMNFPPFYNELVQLAISPTPIASAGLLSIAESKSAISNPTLAHRPLSTSPRRHRRVYEAKCGATSRSPKTI